MATDERPIKIETITADDYRCWTLLTNEGAEHARKIRRATSANFVGGFVLGVAALAALIVSFAPEPISVYLVAHECVAETDATIERWPSTDDGRCGPPQNMKMSLPIAPVVTMNQVVTLGTLAAVGLGLAYLWNKRKKDLAQQSLADLRRRRAEFFQAQKQRWALFYRMHKRQFGLTDEEIVSRYIFVTWGEISGSSPSPKVDGCWYFSTTAPSRDEVLEAIGNDYLIPRSTLEAMAAKFDRNGEAAFHSKYDVIREIIRSCPDEDDEDDQKEEPNQST